MTAMDCWRSFAAAIVDRALLDRKKAQEKLRMNPDNMIASGTIDEIDSFLSSDWAKDLVWFSPEKGLRKVHQGGGRMTRNEKKDWLSRAYHLDRRIRAKMRRAESLSCLATKASSSCDNVPVSASGFTTSKLESIAVRLADLSTEIENDMAELKTISAQIKSAITTVGDQSMVDILEMRYIDMLKWEEISAILNLSTDYAYQLHRKAIEIIRIA